MIRLAFVFAALGTVLLATILPLTAQVFTPTPSASPFPGAATPPPIRLPVPAPSLAPLPRAAATPLSPAASPAASPGASTQTITPLTAPLKEGVETLITCELTHAPSTAETRIFTSPHEADTAKGIWHYKLWLPLGYAANPLKKWPCMFIMSPDGRAVMGTMSEHLKAKSYVVVMLVESKNGQWGPVIGDFLAAHDDVVKRVRIEEGKKLATGFSGGARGSSLFVQARPGFGGLILQGAGPAPLPTGNHDYDLAGLRSNSKLFIAMTAGDKDKNREEIARLQKELGAPGRFMSYEFAGGHQWAPKDTFEQAITWVEQKNGM